LTNQAPADARQRFLHPESLVNPRALNPAISQRTERAILWAMELHPTDRPASIESFRDFLVGNREIPTRLQIATRPRNNFLHLISNAPERYLIWIGAGLLVVSLIASLAR